MAMVTIRNTHWRSVTVQVNVGRETDCNRNPRAGEARLNRDQEWSLDVVRTQVCWRRHADPDHPDDNVWTVWTSVSVFDDDKVIEV